MMQRSNVFSRAGWTRATGLFLALSSGAGSAPAAAQSLLERPPSIQGTWVGRSGTIYFNFMHRFTTTGPPTRKVIQTPTFLLGAGLPLNLLVGAHYATNSTLVPQIPNEWEFFGRYAALGEDRGAPLDLSFQAGYNEAAQSWDGQLALGKRLGPVRVLASGRVFSNAFDQGETRYAWAGGATIRLTEFAALAGDYSTMIDLTDEEGDPAWSAGLHLAIPYTPHTLSFHMANSRTRTLQGGSVGSDRNRYGFEFTVPITLSRYFGSGTAEAGGVEPAVAPGPGGEAAVEVGMTNQLTFTPDTVRIRVGQTVRWTNSSDLLHTVTAYPSRAAEASNVSLPEGAATFDSGNIQPGSTFEHTFSVAGAYQYICVPHELAGMVGWVIVSDSETDGEDGPDV
jgi:plastocyanin